MKRVLLCALISAAVHSGIKAQTTPSTSCTNLSMESPLADVRACADQGLADAQANLGVMYARSLGVPLDYAQALKWFNLAASVFTPGKERDKAATNRDLATPLMTPEQIAEAKNLARQWRPK